MDEVLKEYQKYKFRAAEKELVDAGILVAMCSVMMNLEMDLKEDEFERDEFVDFNIIFDYSKIKDVIDHDVVPHKFESLIVKDIAISLGENISVKEKPNLPIEIDLNKINSNTIIKMPLKLRTNYPEKTSIGPIMITVEIDEKFNFFVKTKIKKVSIVSPDAVLGINLTPKETAVTNRSFPLEVEVFNESDGDASDINIEFEFPEDLRLIRGTNKKNIYSLGSNQNATWVIQVKALDSGDIPVKTTVSFKDGDGNEKGPFTADIPVKINL